MKIIFERLAKVINHHPMLVAGIVIALFIVCLYGMTTISMQTGWETYMVKDSPEGSQYNKYITTFQSDPVVLFIDTDTPISPDMLHFMDGLEGSIRNQQNIKSVSGIADLLKQANNGALPTSIGEIQDAETRVPPQALAVYTQSNLITIIRVDVNEGLSEKTKTNLLNNLQSLVANSNPPPGVKISLTGSAAFSK